MMAKGFVGKKKLEKILSSLKEVKRTATMKNANFEDSTIDERERLCIKEGEVTDFIRNRTRLWRQTWIIEPLDEVIKKLERCL